MMARKALIFTSIFSLMISSFAGANSGNIYRDIQNQFKFNIPQDWVVENQSSNPLSLVIKPSEDGKMGLDPMIIISKIEGAQMPQNEEEVKSIVEQIKIQSSPNPKIKKLKTGEFGIERSERFYWFFYDTAYDYYPQGKKKRMLTRNYVIKSGKNYFSVVLVGPKKEMKKARLMVLELVKSIESIYTS